MPSAFWKHNYEQCDQLINRVIVTNFQLNILIWFLKNI